MQPFIFFRSDNKFVKICFHEIVYVEACKNYIRIHTAMRSFIVLLSMKQAEKELPSDQFCRVHRSFIVSLNHITAFDHDAIYLNTGKQVPLSDHFKSSLFSKVQVVLSEVRHQLKSGVEV